MSGEIVKDAFNGMGNEEEFIVRQGISYYNQLNRVFQNGPVVDFNPINGQFHIPSNSIFMTWLGIFAIMCCCFMLFWLIFDIFCHIITKGLEKPEKKHHHLFQGFGFIILFFLEIFVMFNSNIFSCWLYNAFSWNQISKCTPSVIVLKTFIFGDFMFHQYLLMSIWSSMEISFYVYDLTKIIYNNFIVKTTTTTHKKKSIGELITYIIHHIVTIFLLFAGSSCIYCYYGMFIASMHDISDGPLNLRKFFIGWKKTVIEYIFVISFVVPRIFFFNMSIFSNLMISDVYLQAQIPLYCLFIVLGIFNLNWCLEIYQTLEKKKDKKNK